MGYLTRVLLLVCCAAALVRGWGQQLTFSGVTVPQQTATRAPTAPTATNPTLILGASEAEKAAVSVVSDDSWLGCLKAQKYKLNPIPGIYQASVQDLKGVVRFVPSGTENCGCQKKCPEVLALASGRLLQQRIAGGVVSNVTALGTALRDKLVVGTGFSLLSGPLVASATTVKLETQGTINFTSGGSGGSRLDIAPDSVAVGVGNGSTRLLLQPLQSFFTTPNLYVVASGTGAGVIDLTAASTLMLKAGQATTSVLTQDEIRQISAKWTASVTDTARLEAGGPFLLTSASTMSIHGGTAVAVSSNDTLTLHAKTSARMTSDDRIYMQADAFYVVAGRLLHLSSDDRMDTVVGQTFNLTAPVAEQASTTWTVHTKNSSLLSSDGTFFVSAALNVSTVAPMVQQVSTHWDVQNTANLVFMSNYSTQTAHTNMVLTAGDTIRVQGENAVDIVAASQLRAEAGAAAYINAPNTTIFGANSLALLSNGSASLSTTGNLSVQTGTTTWTGDLVDMDTDIIVQKTFQGVGKIVLGSNDTAGSMTVLNGNRPDLRETIAMDGQSGLVTSVASLTGDLVASRLLPGSSATGSVTADAIRVRYNNHTATPSDIMSNITVDAQGTAVFSGGVQAGTTGTGGVTAGVVAFTGLAVQAQGMPSTYSTIEYGASTCTDINNPCTLVLAGDGPAVYSIKENLSNQGNTVPEIYVNNVIFRGTPAPTPSTGAMIFLYVAGNSAVNFVHAKTGNVAGNSNVVPSVTKKLQQGQFTMFMFVDTSWNAFA